jgi:hypothetical protein
VTIGAQRLAIYPGLGDGINSLIAVESKQFRDNGCRSNLDKDDMIEADSVEGVEESKRALNLMGFDHCFEHITNGEGLALPAEMIGDSENSAKVIRRMTP